MAIELKIKRLGISSNPLREIYFRVLKTTWPRFLGFVAACYLGMNCLFAFLYWLGPNSLMNADNTSYFDAFAFSIQTSATIGYGYFAPQTTYAHIIVISESIISLLFTALVTGITFAKFARPQVHVVFSKNVLITPYEGVPTLMLRMGNGRDSHITEASVT